MRNLLLNLAAGAASVTLTTGIVAFSDPANAAIQPDTSVRQIVRIDDLDLGSIDGRAVATRRIRQAADQVCGVETIRDLGNDQCRSRATERAMQALDARTAAAPVTGTRVASR